MAPIVLAKGATPPSSSPGPTLGASRQRRDAPRLLTVSGGAVFGRRLETAHVDPSRLQRAADAIANPLRIPPFDRRDRHAVDQDFVVQVIAEGETGRAAAPELLTLGDGVAELDRDGREVAVERLQAEAVVEDHGIAVDGERSRVDDDALVGSRHDRLLGGCEIEADVHLRIDLAAL